MTTRYGSPAAFKQALEQRIKSRCSGGAETARARQLVVFDRFLARVVAVFGDAVTLKGGMALELRISRARTTKDVDLRLVGTPDGLLERLAAAGRLDLDDFMRFEVAGDRRHPTIQSEGMRYEGLRFRAECRLAGKVYARPFGVDIAMGDPLAGGPDIAVAEDRLGFAGIAPPVLRLYPIATHVAEKLHAYTMPRERPNTRVKDLPDLALLATTEHFDAVALRAALELTFEFRATHPLPTSLPRPPVFWTAPYSTMAGEDDLRWRSLNEAYQAVADFIDPVLASIDAGRWSHETWCWGGADRTGD